MNRNVESHFSELPHASIERSIFDRSSGHKTSFNVGELIPFFWDEVLPGDTFNITTSIVSRLQTLLTPIMDNMYIDTYYFFVPSRLTWSHWKEFMGENTDSAWIPANHYTTPKISSPENGWTTGTIADYMGIPVGIEFNSDTGLMPSALPFRAYALICNEWFRDQNLTDPLNIPIGDSNQTGSNGDEYINDVANGGKPFKVAKYHDYFTSCLPSPQKGPAVGFSFDGQMDLNLPMLHDYGSADPPYPGALIKTSPDPFYLEYKDLHDRDAWTYQTRPHPVIYVANNGSGTSINYGTSQWYQKKNGTNAGVNVSKMQDYTPGSNTAPEMDSHVDDAQRLIPVNLYADLSGLSGSFDADWNFTINELRLAFQLQKFYEKNARGGSRYRELILSHFGVSSPDARMMIPEYLGGHRFPIAISQVLNQSQSANDYLGDVGAMSNTSDIHSDFIKSFTEHGFVIGVCCVRYDHSYPQGLSREWTRETNLDYYWPVFANIGEQPVYKYEINADAYIPEGEETKDYDERLKVFGYQEAWANYRYKPSRVSGEMRPGILNSLASWHLSDYYTSNPSLSDAWIREDKTNVDRVLAVTSLLANQVFADFYITNKCTRAMPMFSVPGLIDHH